jgi:hypothetical protein
LWQIENTDWHCLLRSNSCTLRAGSKRGVPVKARGQVVREQVQSSVLRTLTSPSKREM